MKVRNNDKKNEYEAVIKWNEAQLALLWEETKERVKKLYPKFPIDSVIVEHEINRKVSGGHVKWAEISRRKAGIIYVNAIAQFHTYKAHGRNEYSKTFLHELAHLIHYHVVVFMQKAEMKRRDAHNSVFYNIDRKIGNDGHRYHALDVWFDRKIYKNYEVLNG